MRSRARMYAVASFYTALDLLPLLFKGIVKYKVRMMTRGLRPGAALPGQLGMLVPRTRAMLQLPLAVSGGQHTMPPQGRRRATLIIVAHKADGAGEHTEMYILDGETGIAHNMGVISLPDGTFKYNNSGWLTQHSIEKIKDVWIQKAHGRDWIAYSTDHRPNEAMASWNRREDGPPEGEWGAGPMRQVIHVEEVEINATGSTVEWVCWWLNPRDPMYTHVVFPRDGKKAPVGVIGFRRASEPEFEDRLHLISDKKDVARFLRNVGEDGHASVKIDGASTHFLINKDGARFYSPRRSVVDGRRIEYTHKTGALQDATSPVPIKGMGEIVFVDTRTGRVLTSTETSGILNANALPPEHLEAQVYVYRVDQVGRKDTLHEPHWEQNRPRCVKVACSSKQMRVPAEVSLEHIEDTKHSEGIVGVPANEPIAKGRKLKWRNDSTDVVITRVEFRPGDKGGIAGAIWYEDPRKPDQEFRTASGFSREQKQAMMANPKAYEGKVIMISEFPGHENRAVQFEGFHQCKDAADVRGDPRLDTTLESPTMASETSLTLS